MKYARTLIFVLIPAAVPAASPADRTIAASDYEDRLKAMWAAQLMGNYAGRPVEGRTTTYDGHDITAYPVKWNDLETATSRNTSGVAGTTGYWDGDDDTCFEYLYAHHLDTTPQPTNAQLTSIWDNDVTLSRIYIANRQAKYQISTYANTVPLSGSSKYNMHGQWAIDSQITTETLGAVSPGMRQRASNLAGQFGSISNEGFPVHAAQFYAAMYAEAPFAADVGTLVSRGLEAVPATSRTRDIIQYAVDLYEADAADASLDWLASRTAMAGTYGSGNRYRHWVESAINTGMTTLAILYGQGDCKDTIECAVRGGYDSDCNPATAAGLTGLMKGYDAVLADLGFASIPQDYQLGSTVSLPDMSHTLDEVAALLRSATEGRLVDILGPAAVQGGVYYLPDAGTGQDSIGPLDEKPDPAGPAGLVGRVLAGGGTVNVETSRASDNPAYDRANPAGIIDGIVDVTYNGHLPYETYDGNTDVPAGGDYYRLLFSEPQTFARVVFYEGDIRWNNVNADPRVSGPRGGYFTDLTVEVLQGGSWVEVTGLQVSEALDPYEFFQVIELTFDGIEGDGIQIRGAPGGTLPYTSIVEMEAYDTVPEPTTILLFLWGTPLLLRRKRGVLLSICYNHPPWPPRNT